MNIDEVEAGPELDALIAEKVMGEVESYAPIGDGLTRTDMFYGPSLEDCDRQIKEAYSKYKGKIWPAQYRGLKYSTDIAAAWEVVEKADLDLIHVDDGWLAFDSLWRGEVRYPEEGHDGFVDGPIKTDSGWAVAPTAPLAICRAALKAIEAKS